MLQAGVPPKFPIPWGNAAGSSYIRSIPTASQIGVEAGAASLTDGFPPVTFEPEGSGGTPPWGQDFNGILKQLSQWAQWQAAGGPVLYDSSFQTAVGGYPKGALIQSRTTANKFWLSTTDNNITNPDSGGAGWIAWGPNGAAGGVLSGTYPNPGFANAPGMTLLSNLLPGVGTPLFNPISEVTFGPLLLAQNGYVTIPGLAILQWGIANVSTGGARYYNATINFPETFPSLCAVAIATCQTNLANSPSAASNNLTAIAYNYGRTGFTARIDSNAGVSGDNLPASLTVPWIAVGF